MPGNPDVWSSCLFPDICRHVTDVFLQIRTQKHTSVRDICTLSFNNLSFTSVNTNLGHGWGHTVEDFGSVCSLAINATISILPTAIHF